MRFFNCRLLGVSALLFIGMAGEPFAQAPEAPPARPAKRPVWPVHREQTADPFGQRVEQLDKSLEIMRDFLQILKQETQVNKGRPTLAQRKDQEGFRGIYLMNRDGADVEFLTAAPGMLTSADPQFSNDGKMIAINGLPSIDAMVKSKIFVYAVEGPFKGSTRDMGHGNTPAWSPDDKQLAYMINPGNPIGAAGGTWIMDVDGGNRRWLAMAWFPRWSPDGKSLVCHGTDQGDNGRMTLIVVDIATGKSRRLLTAPGWQLQLYGGNWSPDGKRVVFVGRHEGKDRLATIDADGSDESIRILYTAAEGANLFGPPAWSPDGKQIVFSMQEETANPPRLWWNSHLYSITADFAAGEPKLLEANKVGHINRAMAFSPDSKKIVFSSER